MYGKDGTDTTVFNYVASGGGGGSSFRGGSYGTGVRLVNFARTGGSGGGGGSAHVDMFSYEGGASEQATYSDASVYGNVGGTGHTTAGIYNAGGGGGAGYNGASSNLGGAGADGQVIVTTYF